jgi:hypothetical protein
MSPAGALREVPLDKEVHVFRYSPGIVFPRRAARAGASVALLLLPTAPASAATIHVPSERPTIQAAIDAASAGDTVLVAAGTYQGTQNTGLDFGGKDLVLRSASGPEVTTIDGEGYYAYIRRALILQNGETAASVVVGITFVDCWEASGGAVYIRNGSSPVFRDCRFLDNFGYSHTTARGGAVNVTEGSSPSFEDCEFVGNGASGDSHGYGGAVYVSSSTPTFTRCTFTGNDAESGGAVYESGGATFFSP